MNITQKLAAIQAELKAPKSQYNSFGKYHYRRAEDILEAVKPLLQKQGLSLICSDDLVLIGDRFYVKATAYLSDGEATISTTAFAREEDEKKGMDGSQVTGASSSYARKYALNGLFCIDDTADSDTTNQGDGKTEGKPRTKKTAPAPTPEPEPAPAPAPTQENKPKGIRAQWLDALARGAVNAQGITAEQAYKAKFNPSPEDWALLMDEVYHYKKENGIQ